MLTIEKAEKNLETAYKNCEYWEKFIGCEFYKKQIASAQGWLSRRRNQLDKLRKELNK